MRAPACVGQRRPGCAIWQGRLRRHAAADAPTATPRHQPPAAAVATRAAAVPAPAAGTDAARNPPKAAPSERCAHGVGPTTSGRQVRDHCTRRTPRDASRCQRHRQRAWPMRPADPIRRRWCGHPRRPRDAAGAAAVATTGRNETAVADPPGAKLTRADLLQAEHAWFDAHYRGDHSAMGRVAAHEFELKDDRTSRPTPGLVSMERTVRNLAVDIWGGGAVDHRVDDRAPEGRVRHRRRRGIVVRRNLDSAGRPLADARPATAPPTVSAPVGGSIGRFREPAAESSAVAGRPSSHTQRISAARPAPTKVSLLLASPFVGDGSPGGLSATDWFPP